jgi:hypothetical protein
MTIATITTKRHWASFKHANFPNLEVNLCINDVESYGNHATNGEVNDNHVFVVMKSWHFHHLGCSLTQFKNILDRAFKMQEV